MLDELEVDVLREVMAVLDVLFGFLLRVLVLLLWRCICVILLICLLLWYA